MALCIGAGVAALVIAANPSLTADEVRQILFDTAEDFGVEGGDNDFGHGRIRAEAAVEAALVDAGTDVPAYTPVPVPLHEGFVVTADITGRATTTVAVTDTTYPLAVTALGEDGAIVLGVDVTSGSGLSTGIAINTGAHRHGYDSVARPAVGTYTVTVLTQPLADVVLAVSHSRTATP